MVGANLPLKFRAAHCVFSIVISPVLFRLKVISVPEELPEILTSCTTASVVVMLSLLQPPGRCSVFVW